MASNLRQIVNIQRTNFAKLAHGASECQLGDTKVLVTAVSERAEPRGFTPLTVDFKQKGGFAKRTDEMLACRIIDRSIRPCFPEGFNYDTQIVCNALNVDGCNDPDVLAINGASASLALSDIPWRGPIGAARVGLIGETLVPNPTWKERELSRLNLVLAANRTGNIMMIDGSSKAPLLMPDLIKAIKFGVKECQKVVDSISKLQDEYGKPKRSIDLSHIPKVDEINLVKEKAYDLILSVIKNKTHDKQSRDIAMKEVQERVLAECKSTIQNMDGVKFTHAFTQLIRIANRQLLSETGLRCDGRELNQLRPISMSVNLFKNRHGSAVFQRGQTQVFCSTTFDAPDAKSNFELEYEFPPFATGETGRMSAYPGRREVGHGALAEKAIRPLVPENLDMTARLNCEVWESNGSSSMASVCAGSLSLMDAGVQIKEHVAGVAMGLMGDNILTDILGYEDYFGDMDFKIAGTKKAITALQLDVKLESGLPISLIYESLERAHKAKGEIINKMNNVIRDARKEKKECHPETKTIYVPPHKKSKFIGLGGVNLKRLAELTGVKAYNIDDAPDGSEQRDNFLLFAPNKTALSEAEKFIQTSLEAAYKEPELEFNGIYTATIEELRPNGVMVTLYPNMQPTLLPNSQLDIRPISHPSALNYQPGQQIQVKYFGRDPASGQIRISRKSLLMSSNARVHRSPMA